MSNKSYGILIDYKYCTGCHSCETACKVEQNLPTGQYGIKLFQDGPRKMINGKWEYNHLPMPTSLCDMCEKRVKEGKLPTCVHHCQAACMYYGTVDELAEMMKSKPKSALFMPR